MRADAEASGALLRCWVRETGVAVSGSTLRLDLPASGTRIEAPVDYVSASGAHSFGPIRFASGSPVSPTVLAALLATEAAGSAEQVDDLCARVADSTARIAEHLAADLPAAQTPFLTAEQALVLGHPFHPAPKSRPGLTGPELAAYSPERGGSFPLHWFAADAALVSGDSALHEPVIPDAPPVPAGFVAVPAHPWQARDVRSRPAVAELLDAGGLLDLGPAGPLWWPTSSLRTVYRPDAPVMLKFSLGLPITNSRRNHLPLELRRGLEVHRLLEAGLGAELHRAHPRFDVVRDPAWLAVEHGPEPTGLEIVVRDNPFPGAERAYCVAGLVAHRPVGSMLAELLGANDAREWFRRYLGEVIEPVLWLYQEHGLGLEAHQQNSIVLLDEHGWPVGGRYRDNQGFYFSAERSGFRRDLGTHCPDAVIDERLGYYVGINNALGVIGALGSSGLAEESALLTDLRMALHRIGTDLARQLADTSSLRCKANLRTRIAGMDELVGPLESQSVYVDIPNPIAGARR